MNENYLKYKYYASRCEMADEYKKITGEELQPLGEDWENYKKGDLNDILYDIDMQLYDEFNDKIATMNDYLGDIYSLRDVEEVENAQKEKEIELLRIAITKLQNKIKKALEFIDDKNNFFEDGENWQNVLKIKEILEEN